MTVPAIVITIIIVSVAIILLLASISKARSGGLVMLSHLQCRNCGRQFDYAWIPGMSLSAIRLFHSRYFACPICGKWSVFNIWDTRVDPEKHYCGNIRVGPS
jgi:transcription elongation factor Elf1